MLNDQEVYHPVSDVLIASALQDNPITMSFHGVIQTRNQKRTLVEMLLFDMAISHTKLSVMDKKKRELIKKWLPNYSSDLKTDYSLLALAVCAGCLDTVLLLLKKGWHIDRPGNDLTTIHVTLNNRLLGFSRDSYKAAKPIIQVLLDDRFHAQLNSSH